MQHPNWRMVAQETRLTCLPPVLLLDIPGTTSEASSVMVNCKRTALIHHFSIRPTTQSTLQRFHIQTLLAEAAMRGAELHTHSYTLMAMRLEVPRFEPGTFRLINNRLYVLSHGWRKRPCCCHLFTSAHVTAGRY